MSEEGEVFAFPEAEDDGDNYGVTLTKSEATSYLTCIGPTYRDLEGSKNFAYPTYAYIAMAIIGRNLVNISVLPEFSHVIYLDLTRNFLTDESLKPLHSMKQLRALILDNNRVQNVASVPELNNLQLLSVKDNWISNCEVRELENLLYLDLSYNNIQRILPYLWCPYILPNLAELSMRGNGLKKLAGFLFSNLVSLFLAENQITKIEGLELLQNLKFLHLRQNPIAELNGFDSPNRKLFYLNLRDCQIERVDEFKKLGSLLKLERLVVTGNPFFNAEDSRLKLVAMLPRLRRINKDDVSESERVEATEIGFDRDDESGNAAAAAAAGGDNF